MCTRETKTDLKTSEQHTATALNPKLLEVIRYLGNIQKCTYSKKIAL